MNNIKDQLMFFHKKRDVHGFLLLDKPKGISSNKVLQKVKHIFHAKKAGYIGTLDPLATGMLPICFGECTKFSRYLTESNKQYYVIAKLGETTSTSDSDGIVIKKRPVFFTSSHLYASIQKFIGFIHQVPSMYSAIKYRGIPLYKYARQGINILRGTRSVYIHNLDFIYQENNFIAFNIICSKGTYIRTLIEDLGEQLGCGAHVVFLRRLQIASYSYTQLVQMSDLYKLLNTDDINKINFFKKIDNLLLSSDNLISFLPKIYLSVEELYHFKLGKKFFVSSNINNSLVRVIEKKNKSFIGLGKISIKQLLVPYRLVSIFAN